VGGELDGCEVELRGRVNCGPAFDGDEVRVKVYWKDKKDSSETDNSDNSSPLCGRVVDVVKRNVHRTARTFVCTVGRHFGHLMTPLCGTAPKFHVIDSCLQKRYGSVKKHNYVAVYHSDLTLRKIVKLDSCLRKNMLFVVKYLKWESNHKYPLGYVCSILRQSCTDEDSEKILNLMYEVPASADLELETFEEDYEKDTEVRRKDLCKLLTVSIDSPNTKDIDDALSLQENNGKFFVWVHISDVTFYIKKGDELDMKAQSRLLSFYPKVKQQPRHMLPKKLAEEKCSLLENSCRRAMSVLFELTAEGEVQSSTGPFPSWIRNDKQLSYEEVQEIIDGHVDVPNYAIEVVHEDIELMLIKLHKLATALRKQRMGDGCHFYEYTREHCFNCEGIDDPFDVDQNHDAHRLVEEFMVLTNKCVGEILRQKFPECTLFRVQSAPSDKLLESWKRNHGYIIPYSFYLKQYLNEDNPAATPLFMLRKCWDAISIAVDQGDARKVRTIIGSEKLHPLHNIALLSWFHIQERSQYACTLLVCNGPAECQPVHYSLHACSYVHFTSPIRRYPDVIAHRLVKASPHEPPPYTPDEIVALCRKVNARRSMQRSYDHAGGLLRMARMLQRPIYMPCYVETFDDFSIHLASPYFRNVSASGCRLKFSEMEVREDPRTCSESGRNVTLKWSKRCYDTRMSSTTGARSDCHTDYVLDPGMFGTTVSPDVWTFLHNAVTIQGEDLLERVSEAVQMNLALQQQRLQVNGTVKEVTSEMAGNWPLVRHHVKFSCDITRGAVVSVQFGAQAVRGFLQPVIKLVNLTPEKDICVEHQRDPVYAFASVATKKVKQEYQNLEEYQDIWQAILAMEAATNAVHNNEAIICCHVPVKFKKRNGIVYATIELSREFCNKRFIGIYRVSEEETHDYLCIRYFPRKSRLLKSFDRNVWVAHATAVRCTCKEDDITLIVKCSGNENEAPVELFHNAANECTVEFIQRALPDK